jgi:hypothetical protein
MMYAPQTLAALGVPGSMIGAAGLSSYGFGGVVGLVVTVTVLVFLLLMVVVARTVARRSSGD